VVQVDHPPRCSQWRMDMGTLMVGGRVFVCSTFKNHDQKKPWNLTELEIFCAIPGHVRRFRLPFATLLGTRARFVVSLVRKKVDFLEEKCIAYPFLFSSFISIYLAFFIHRHSLYYMPTTWFLDMGNISIPDNTYYIRIEIAFFFLSRFLVHIFVELLITATPAFHRCLISDFSHCLTVVHVHQTLSSSALSFTRIPFEFSSLISCLSSIFFHTGSIHFYVPL